MREILFRGKTTDRGEWVQGCYTETLRYNNLHWIWNGKNHFTVNPETVGQYTGLTDKNGKKIFEGDIVREVDIKHKDETQIKGKVYEIKMRKGCWVVYNCNFKLEYEKWDFLNTFASSVEIIGNIHDNPKLLGAE